VRELSPPPACDVPYQGEAQRMTAALQNKQSWMIWPERVLLYATVLGLRPARTLEIGTFLGGSAQIITAALDTIGHGSLICVDLNPRVAPENWAKVGHRATMVAEPSPDGLTTAKRVAGGLFDFALIDGDHTYDGVVRDIEGTLPVLADRAYLLFHDAYFHEVEHGIDDMVRKYARELTEVGMMSAEPVPDRNNPGVVWGGFRMLRFDRAK
jgi:predicted O-methyltransferase YrrM